MMIEKINNYTTMETITGLFMLKYNHSQIYGNGKLDVNKSVAGYFAVGHVAVKKMLVLVWLG